MKSTARRSIAFGALLAVLAASPLMAQPKMPPPPVKDFKAAPAGTYALDPGHTGVVARVPHMGFSFEVFRFTGVEGSLTWDPANPDADALSVSVDPKSITTAPTGTTDFAAELAGDKFLNVAKFPTATFVSKHFHVIDPSHGKVEGDLTIMGVTKPAVFDVELVGAGPGFRGPVIGVTARTVVDPSGYGLPPFASAPLELVIDTEFDRK